MQTVMLALFALAASGSGAFLVRENEKVANRIGLVGCILGCTIGLLPAFRGLLSHSVDAIRWSWNIPEGSISFSLDALSALFLVPVFGLSFLGAVYGMGYRAGQPNRKPAGTHWFFYNILVASMAAVVTARNGLLFLMVWEIMALASYFLVTTDDERENVREAGWTYLVATHLGTAFLFGLFVVLGHRTGSLDFDSFTVGGPMEPKIAATAFILAVIGFGAKAGFVPFHVWLPEAHPAAPSHVSALMSGVMIKTGIYGLMRTLTFLGPPPAWWGWALLVVGIVCAVYGIAFAMVQHDLKRLLAYSSVENVGIITLGLGAGVLGLSAQLPYVAALGFAGALLHVVNHAMLKGLLFLGAGSVLHAAGTGAIDRLGGLMKKMPKTGVLFVIGATAVCGLPPFNGFVGEFLIFLASLEGSNARAVGVAVPLAGGIAGLALVSGLAAACFSKAFGTVFLGEPRTDAVPSAHDPGRAMLLPQVALAAACLAAGLVAPWMVRSMVPAVTVLSGTSSEQVATSVARASGILAQVSLGSCALILLSIALAFLRLRLLRGRSVSYAGTWDCGYAAPTARMSYTGSSYAQPLADVFFTILRTKKEANAPKGIFPGTSEMATATPDTVRDRFYDPLFTTMGRGLRRLRWLQHGNLHLYVLYIAITLFVLLVWKLG